MELLEGETLETRLLRGPMLEGEATTIAHAVARAMGTAHRHELVHRDVKPSNVFLTSGPGRPIKLLDFGLVRSTREKDSLTHSGSLLGTMGYMAPEQARGARDIDARADVFALGCVLFECLTGKSPFAGADFIAVLTKILFEEPPRIRSIQPRVSGPLEDLIAKMLAKDPAARPENGMVVAELLESMPALSQRMTAAPVSRGPVSRGLTEAEQRMAWVVIATGALEHYCAAQRAWSEEGPTLTSEDADEMFEHLRAAVRPFQATLEGLNNGKIKKRHFRAYLVKPPTSRGAARR